MEFSGHIVYGVCFIIFGLGLYVTITSGNLVKKLFGLAMLQASVMLMFIAIGYIKGGLAPIIKKGAEDAVYVNPLPQVLILTAIVVGLATLAVGLALCVQIKKKFGKIDESVNYD